MISPANIKQWKRIYGLREITISTELEIAKI
jgi:hypothetical protein